MQLQCQSGVAVFRMLPGRQWWALLAWSRRPSRLATDRIVARCRDATALHRTPTLHQGSPPPSHPPREDGTFVIAQFTDMHYGQGAQNDLRTDKVHTRMPASCRPAQAPAAAWQLLLIACCRLAAPAVRLLPPPSACFAARCATGLPPSVFLMLPRPPPPPAACLP